MASKLFDIEYGRAGSDCTSKYYVTLKRECTVGEFINEWMKDTREWGHFGIVPVDIAKRKEHILFGNPACEYKHGSIVGDPLPDYILNSKIKYVFGSGGWSRSDFQFVI